MHCNSAGKDKLRPTDWLKPEPTLEELLNLDLVGVVGKSSQLHHRVLGTLIGPGLTCPGVAGVLHLRVLGPEHQSEGREQRTRYLTLEHFYVSLAHVTLVLLQGGLNVRLILHLDEGFSRRSPLSEESHSE